MVGDSAGSAGDTAAERRGVSPGNFVITDDFALGEGTDGAKIKGNIAAIELTLALEAENRFPTKAEQEVLARYVGWGGLKSVFDPKKTGSTDQYGRAQARLKELLTKDQYRAAGRSTADAHYTSRTIVNGMWRALQGFGFTGGRALEPTVGTGNFIGLMPQELTDNTEWFGAELDKITGQIAKHLYPDATIFDGTGFQNAPFRNGSVDVAIGNPPFGSDRISSKLYPEIPTMNVHNFIIAKTGMHLREGGIMGMVITSRFMDTANPQGREYLARHFNFLGAVRLPNTAFKANAGTEVTTDIVWFQKRREGEPAGDLSWLQTDVDGPNGTKLNGYFAANPQMMLGTPGMDGTMYGDELEFTLHDDGRDLESSLREALDTIDAELPSRTEALESAVVQAPTVSDLTIGQVAMLEDGRVMIRREDDADGNAVVHEVTESTPWSKGAEGIAHAFKMAKQWQNAAKKHKAENYTHPANATQAQRNIADSANAFLWAAVDAGSVKEDYSSKATAPTGMGKKAHEAIGALAAAAKTAPTKWGAAQTKALRQLDEALSDKAIGKDKLARLRKMLDLRNRTVALLAAEAANDPRMEKMRADLRKAYTGFVKAHGYVNNPANDAIVGGVPGMEAALESRYKAANKRKGRAESAEQAPILRKRVIVPYTEAESASSSADGLHISMRERGKLDLPLIAKLTGKSVQEVRDELTAGEKPLVWEDPATGEFVLADEYLSGNLAEKIEAAKNAGLPKHIEALQAAMPAPKTAEQISPTIRSMWIPGEVFNDFATALGAAHAKVRPDPKSGTMFMELKDGARPTEFGSQFRTERRTALEIFDKVARGKELTVFDRGPNKTRVKNEQATIDAGAAAERMAAEFEKWVYANPERKALVVDAFNKTMNVIVDRGYNGVEYLTTVGANPEITLRNSQKNGAWRMIQSPSTLLHHIVGAGKTFTAITAIMERKRLGLSRKTLVAVPNHLVGQWARDFYALYPGANILAPSEKDFSGANRRKLLARMATGDYDAIVIGHSQLKKIENSEADQRRVINEQIDDLEESLEAARREGDSGRTVQQIQNRIEKYKEKLDELVKKQAADDIGITFDQTGVDNLVVDEAHEFKNLEYSTAAQRVVGMNNPTGSERAFDLYMKTRSMFHREGAVGFLTGTPVSNSLVEIYTMLKYMAPQQLRSMGLGHFDAWSSAFIQTQDRFEYTPAMKLKQRRVMSGMVNLGPLSQLYKTFADIVMRKEVEAMYAEQIEAENAKEPDPAKHKPTKFPTPKVKGGARQLVKLPSSPAQDEFTDYLVMRSDAIKKNSKDKEYPKIDNMLWVLSDARKASIDIRTVDTDGERTATSKVVAVGDNVMRIAKAWEADKGTQLIFADSSVPAKAANAAIKGVVETMWRKSGLTKAQATARAKQDQGKPWIERAANAMDAIETALNDGSLSLAKQDEAEEYMNSEGREGLAMAATADSGFSFYDDVRDYLVELGMDPKEIAFIHDYDTADKKADLFEDVNEGRIRVLLGSTFKMGAGMNVQERLVGLHHIDAPWRPSDMEQREGRIIRQGNELYGRDPEGFEVEINAYATEKTSDVVLWQVLERKAAGIEQFLNSTADSLQEEGDADSDVYANFMAQSTGNPVFLKKMQAEKDFQNAEAAQASEIMAMTEAREFVARSGSRLDAARKFIKLGQGLTFDAFPDAGKRWEEYRAEAVAYQDAKEAHEEAANAVRARNAVLPEGAKPEKLPTFDMKAPTIFPEGAKLDAYSARIKRAIEGMMGGVATDTRSDGIPLGDGLSVHMQMKRNSDPEGPHEFEAWLQTGNDTWNLMGFGRSVQVKNPLASRALVSAMMPGAVQARLNDLIGARTQEIERIEEALPYMQEKAEREVDRSEVKRLARDMQMYRGLVRVAEVEAAQARMGRSNKFADRDHDRPLERDNSDDAPILQDGKPFKVEVNGLPFTAPFGAKQSAGAVDGKQMLDYWLRGTFAGGDEALVLMRRKTEGTGESAKTTEEVVEVFELEAEQEGEKQSRLPVATLNGDELGKWRDMRDLGEKAAGWYRDNLIGTTVTNAQTGMKIGFNTRGSRKIGGRKGDKLYRMVPALREILSGGEVVETMADNRGRAEVVAVHKIAATVVLAGQPEKVIAHIREMANGTYHYDLSMDSGARSFSTPTAQGEPRASALEGDPAILNLAFAGDEINTAALISPADARRINAAARAELEKVGIAGRVSARAGGDGSAAGTYRAGVIRILRTKAGQWRHTLDHEILHALRDGDLWGREAGLFTRAEWSALARAARADKELRKRIEAAYPDLSEAGRTEEMVAEFYADWAQGRRDAPAGAMREALGRIRSFFRAVASALRGEGFTDAATVMQRIADGTIGGRGPDGPGGGSRAPAGATKEQRDMAELRRAMADGKARAAGMVGRFNWKKTPDVFSNWLTDAMGRNARFNILGAVPGHPLFAELGKKLVGAQTYLGLKQKMDAERNDWQARASDAVDQWTKIGRKNPEANDQLMDLMHESTIAGIDPTRPDEWVHPQARQADAIEADEGRSEIQRLLAERVRREIADHKATRARLEAAYRALPREFQKAYRDIRDEYSAMADATDAALIQNVKTANEIALKRARHAHEREMRRIEDEGLQGAEKLEAMDKADARLAATEKRAKANGAARMASLRATFEANRLKGPYFPLARFGTYFVTVRNADREVISFSRFQTKGQQDTAVAEAEKDGAAEGWTVERGVLNGEADLRGMVDPRFVADLEQIMEETGASPETMDAIWQHWLESLPDLSVRKAKIHRKGRKGFNKDAVRAFSSAMFHGAHNIARLRYGLRMDEALNDAEAEAAKQPDPERAGFVVREMRQRHNFTMKPTNNPLVSAATSLAFVWYLGMSPAAAMVNISQTTIMGVPIMATRFKQAGVTGTADALWKAAQDFGRGKGWSEKSANLTADEREAMRKAYDLGTIDRTQAHDLAAVAESGVEYRPGREKMMRVVGFMFHHAERLNREVTFLAAYRLLRAEGMSQDEALQEADGLVKKVHFDYQNTSRPRVMQGDAAKIILTFRNFTVNALYRLFRDAHQAFAGDSAEARREARGQLVGISLSMMAHAGIKGVWGYGLIMSLLAAFFPGDDDDIEQWLQDVLLMEGDDLGTASWNWTMGMVLNGVPGQVAGVSLTERIGMPNLWFRPARAGTEGQDLWAHYLNEIAGPVFGIGGNFAQGMSMMTDAWGDGNGENALRGVEKMAPTFIRNLALRPTRYSVYGANTYYGDSLMDVGPLDALRVGLGFTPAKLAERYDINNRLKAKEREISGERSTIHRIIGKAVVAGDPIPESALARMREFNATYPEYPITPDTIRASIRGRARMKERNEFGVSLNPKLNDRLRGELAPSVYN